MAALDKRPNQAPLIAALRVDPGLPDQNKMRGQAQQTGPATIGINQYDPTIPASSAVRRHGRRWRLDDGGGINIPLGPDRRARPRLLEHPGVPGGPGPAAAGRRRLLYNPRLRRAYRIEDGIPVLLVDEARDVDDDGARAAHRRAEP